MISFFCWLRCLHCEYEKWKEVFHILPVGKSFHDQDPDRTIDIIVRNYMYLSNCSRLML